MFPLDNLKGHKPIHLKLIHRAARAVIAMISDLPGICIVYLVVSAYCSNHGCGSRSIWPGSALFIFTPSIKSTYLR